MNTIAAFCLALNVYAEARGEIVEGQIGVAHVTINRMADPRYPDDICGVVYDPDQFSWTDQPLWVNDEESLARAMFVALSALMTDQPDPTDGATHFYSGSPPKWAKAMVITAQIGNHTFLKEPSQ